MAELERARGQAPQASSQEPEDIRKPVPRPPDVTTHLLQLQENGGNQMVLRLLGAARAEDGTADPVADSIRARLADGNPLLAHAAAAGAATRAMAAEPSAEPQPWRPSVTASKSELEGWTSEAVGLNVRKGPAEGSELIGKLRYREMNVAVIDSVTESINGVNRLWLKVRFGPADFQAVTKDKPNGTAAQSPTEGWIVEGAMAVVVMPFSDFLTLVKDFDKQFKNESVLERLSRLRQIGENADVAANRIMSEENPGRKLPNQTNRDQRKASGSGWTLLYEAKQVQLPDGEIVDIHHLLLGAESRVPEHQVAAQNVGYVYPIGENFAAATWSGDIGAAAAELAAGRSKEWEKENKGAGQSKRDEFYFRARAPESDLLGDLDAWGAAGLLPSSTDTAPNIPSSIEEFLGLVYGNGLNAAEHAEKKEEIRVAGIKSMLFHYKFTSVDELLNESAAGVKLMKEQTRTFAGFWAVAKNLTVTLGEIHDAADRMTSLYLKWLHGQAVKQKVDLGDKGGKAN